MNANASQFATVTSKLGVHVATTTHATQRAAELAAGRAVEGGAADSAAVYRGQEAVRFFGSGR